MSNIRVLVVDDHDLFRTGLSSLLGEEPDIDVVAQASGGRAGVRLAHELRPDVVLMGLSITDQPAPEATREILSDRPSTCVVMMAGDPGEEDIEEALRAGARGFLAKDTPIREVVTAVKFASGGGLAIAPRRRARARANAQARSPEGGQLGVRRGPIRPRARRLATPRPRSRQRSDCCEAGRQPARSQKPHRKHSPQARPTRARTRRPGRCSRATTTPA